MFDGLQYLVSLERPWTELLRDVFDILIVAFMAYRVLLVMKGTRAMQVGLGFGLFGVLYVVAKYAQLATLMSVLSWLASSAILIVVVVFQNDIRRALIRVGSKAWLRRGQDAQERLIDDVVSAATDLARHRTGALVCIERDANVAEFVKNDGIELDSVVTRELLVALFLPEEKNKLHDGAVLIRNLRIARAGLFFPMPESTRVPDPSWGSRHRAAIGITEETDALVVVVSEETGRISLFYNQNHVLNLNGPQLRDTLIRLIKNESDQKQQSAVKRVTLGLATLASRAAREVQQKAEETDDDAPPSSEKRDAPKTPAPKSAVKNTAKPATKTAASKTSSAKTTTKPPAGKTSASQAPAPKTKAKAKGEGRSERKSEAPPAVEKKRSGRFTALPRQEEEDVPPSTAISVPMPSGKNKLPVEDEESVDTADETPTTTAPASVSKPMAKAELPTTSMPPNQISGEDT